MQANQMGDNLEYVNLPTDVVPEKIFTNYSHSCVITSDEDLYCWGANSNGQLGLGSTQNRYGSGGFAYIYLYCKYTADTYAIREGIAPANDDFYCNNPEGGILYEWGIDADGDSMLSDAEANTFNSSDTTFCHSEDHNLIASYTEIFEEKDHCEFGGYEFTVKYDYDKDGIVESSMGDLLPKVDLGNSSGIKDLSMSYYNTCVLFNDNQLKCWGEYGTLGLDTDNHWGDEPTETPANVMSPDLGTDRYAIDISGRGYQMCALLDNYEVKCWGYSDYGETGYPEYYSEYIGDGDPEIEMGDNLPPVDLY